MRETISLPFYRCRYAFSLVELSLVLVIIGALTGFSITLTTAWLDKEEFNTTRMNLETIHRAIDTYRHVNGRLPCPGDPNALPGDAGYGREAFELGDTSGVCAGEAGINASVADASAGVVFGSVPAVTLGLGENLMRDAWGNLIVYYVTERATLEGSFQQRPRHANYIAASDNSLGRIIINDENGSVRSDVALYALVSHGANGFGAITASGNMLPIGGASANEIENTSSTPNNILVGALVENSFDDIVEYKERRHLDNPIIWTEAPQTSPSGPSPCVPTAIGETCGGGIAASTGTNALIAATADAPGMLQWGSMGVLRGTSSTSDGSVNTATLETFGAVAHPAASYCANLNEGGYDDWYLPSKDELDILFQNRGAIGGFVLSGSDTGYWTSSEYSSLGVWSQYFLAGFPSGSNKTNNHNVRCVRRNT